MYCSQPCRTRGARFERECNKSGLSLNTLKTVTELKNVENMVDRMHKESKAKVKKLKEAGRVNEALETITQWQSDLTHLNGKWQGLHRKEHDLHDKRIDLRRLHGLFVNEDEF